VLAFGILLFFESGNEFILGGYYSSYLTRDLHVPVSKASYALAGYWAAMMLARVVLGRLLLRMRGELLIRISALSVAICVLLLTTVHSPGVAAVLGAVLGASTAAIFPTALGLAGTRYGSHSGTVFGLLIGIALTGGMLMPWTMGRVAAAHSIRVAWLIPAAAALAIFVLQLVTERLGKEQTH
jgi:fucose permease